MIHLKIFHPGILRYPVVKTILLSLGIHILFLSLVAFSFPVRITNQEPAFVFLGPILQKQDLVASRKSDLKKLIEGRDIPQVTAADEGWMTVGKPHSAFAAQKNAFKPKLNEESPEESTPASSPGKMEEALPIPPYAPLRLYSNDKN